MLLGAAVLGGALNAVAGGGSFFTFPALVFTGIPAVPANATSALALWPGSIASVAAYRHELYLERGRLLPFAIASFVGGLLGAVVLVVTPPTVFERALPFLLLIATALFAYGPRILAALRGPGAAMLPLPMSVAVQFVISIYGGYFGGGMGMMMLAAFSLLGMQDIHRMNGLKTFLSVVINVVSLATFVAAGVIVWREGLLMTAGAIAGGYGGAAVAKRLSPLLVRGFIIATGAVLTVIFFYRSFVS